MREQGVTKYLCENEDYLDAIRTGEVVCKNIDVGKIKEEMQYLMG